MSLHSQQIIQNFICICRAQGVRDDAHAAREATGVMKANLFARPPDTHPLSIPSHHLEILIPSPSDQPDTHPALCSHLPAATGHALQAPTRQRWVLLQSTVPTPGGLEWTRHDVTGD